MNQKQGLVDAENCLPAGAFPRPRLTLEKWYEKDEDA